MGITVSYTGDLKKTMRFLSSSKKINMKNIVYFAELCIERLKEETPVKTGLTRNSWEYTIEKNNKGVIININNTNIQNGINIAVLLDMGHATKDGQYISGLHFINPVINYTFREIIDNTWKELNKQ